MKYSNAELRVIHAAHRELGLQRLLTVEEFMEAHNTARYDAEIVVNRAIEKRARQLGPELARIRKEAAPADTLDQKIAANEF